jgi:chaperonin GroEL
VFLQGAGDQLESVKVENFGRARRVWADADYLGIAGAGGDPRVFRHHVAKLRAIFAQAAEPDQRKAIQERIGRLLGGSATLRVGGYSDTESRARKELAERSADVLRAAVRGGVLPGGGAALLACQHQLNARHKDAKTVEERAAYAILIKALEAPIRTIATNSGYDPSQVIASVHHNTNGHGFDMLSGAVVDMVDAGIVDVAVAYRSAIQSAISSAAQTLTIDALVHCKNPEQVLDPG